MRKLLIATLIFSAVLAGPRARAMETDQYNLPPTPLADIGDEFTQYVWDNIFTAAARLNAEIAAHEACIRSPAARQSKCASDQTERKKLAELRSPDALAKAVYKLLGDGTIFTSHTGDWLTTHEFAQTPSRYKTSFTDSIFVTMPIDYATLSPTIRVNGVEMGTDKFDHFFQQGYRYYKIYDRELAKGRTPDEAAKRAIAWGKKTEKTIYGYLVSGVFSNADLFANYAGMKFYLGLTQPVKIGDTTREPTLSLVEGQWQVNIDADERAALLKPFVTDRMNEALNPSGYTFFVYPTVRDVVRKKSCPQWRTAFPTLTRDELATRSKALELWKGENYGFSRRSRMVTLADACFGD
jgi:hypothetical protein